MSILGEYNPFRVKKSSRDSNSAYVPASKFRFHPAAEAELTEAAEWYLP